MKKVLVLDFGSQYTQLIARKVRELKIYSEIFPYSLSPSRIKKESPGALILSGGPQSVNEKNAPLPSPEIFKLGIPVLGICYGLQLMAYQLGGKVTPSRKREYGFASLNVRDREGLLSGVEEKSQVWMSHGDRVERVPPGFVVSGVTSNCDTAVVEWREKKIFGVQFHPEVIHSREGMKVLSNFLFSQSGLKPEWDMGSFIEENIKALRQKIGEGKVVCGLSGGVDSIVTALLVNRAAGENLSCIFVNNGLLRQGQDRSMTAKLQQKFGLKIISVNASGMFLKRLKGVISPERKRKIIGEVFIQIFEKEAAKIGNVEFLAQGTIYPDVIESSPVKGPSATIKTHHNVGGLPKGLKFNLVEPLRDLFKDEVRDIGLKMGLERDFIDQHPFPGPGLAVRIVGEVTRDRLRILREADDILLQEVRKAGLYNNLWQAFAVLLPVRSVGVMGDRRTYQRVIVVRLVQSVDGMTANWYAADPEFLGGISTRIVNEVKGVNRVVYDITSKPPGTIEWE